MIRDYKDELNLLQVFLILKELKGESYLVGGCVRDGLRNIESKDYDIVTDIHMDRLSAAFKEAGWKVDETGKQFLVLNVSRDGFRYEIANFRKDGIYLDGRKPEEVEVGTIKEDAERRDFTVNALYYEPFKNKVHDPLLCGLADIRSGTLRFIGKAEERIKEDRLRIFRFYRFISKGFSPEPRSLRACRTFFKESYALIEPERVRGELEKIVL